VTTRGEFLAELLRGLSWPRWRWTLLLACALPLTGVYNSVLDWTPARIAGVLPLMMIFGAITLVSVSIAEASSGPRGPHLWRCLAAVAVAAALSAALCAAMPDVVAAALDRPPMSAINRRAALSTPREPWREGAALFGGLATAVYGLLVVTTYVRMRQAQLAARSLAEAELARAAARAWVVASDLEGARASYDGPAVIERLERIERRYEIDPASAEAMLDRLIADLRESIPRLRAARIAAGAQ
jgi:hypothetical protein